MNKIDTIKDKFYTIDETIWTSTATVTANDGAEILLPAFSQGLTSTQTFELNNSSINLQIVSEPTAQADLLLTDDDIGSLGLSVFDDIVTAFNIYDGAQVSLATIAYDENIRYGITSDGSNIHYQQSPDGHTYTDFVTISTPSVNIQNLNINLLATSFDTGTVRFKNLNTDIEEPQFSIITGNANIYQ